MFIMPKKTTQKAKPSRSKACRTTFSVFIENSGDKSSSYSFHKLRAEQNKSIFLNITVIEVSERPYEGQIVRKLSKSVFSISTNTVRPNLKVKSYV